MLGIPSNKGDFYETHTARLQPAGSD